ncbi:hypothetical protein FBZ93_10531 [Bradyrhizobium macuxiense]|uniref:Uncharacterized protein n=1 Tax=Bradyrhizobium macuxiense TaxID=1755647 RepID=A0A560LXR1_9BRAD|nr:hypothetical protein FBZ93_10531 [Bradyrhizobium macuxiense]
MAAKVISVAPNDDGVRIHYRRRDECQNPGHAGVRRLHRHRRGSVRYAESGGVRPVRPGLSHIDPLCIGIKTDRNCAIIGRDGEVSQRLFAIGPLRRTALGDHSDSRYPQAMRRPRRPAGRLTHPYLIPSGLNRASGCGLSGCLRRSSIRRFRRTKSGSVTSSARRGRPNGRRMFSMTRPGLALITMTRSARNSASSISCVTKMVVVGILVQMSSRTSCIMLRVCASSAPNGSSINSTRGRLIRTRAISTRCCIPPESCEG